MINSRNPAVKRIRADVKELQSHPSSRYFAQPLENNMFEWHFTIRGPADTAFADGVYHGRILLPSEYPFKPPNIVFLTKNGRFEVGTKICLSISAYHEESWQPAWGVRTMLEAIISFMPTEGMGAIGALDWTPEERKKLATESKAYCCSACGKVADLLSDPKDDVAKSPADEKEQAELAAEIAKMHLKAAPIPHSPHAQGANSSFMSDFGADLGLKASLGGELGQFGTPGATSTMVFDGKSAFQGTTALDTITTSVSAPPLEDSDGLADFLPDLPQRMEQLDNCIDAQDNVDNMGMLEQEDEGVYLSKANSAQTEHTTVNNDGADAHSNHKVGADYVLDIVAEDTAPIARDTHLFDKAATPANELRQRKGASVISTSKGTCVDSVSDDQSQGSAFSSALHTPGRPAPASPIIVTRQYRDTLLETVQSSERNTPRKEPATATRNDNSEGTPAELEHTQAALTPTQTQPLVQTPEHTQISPQEADQVAEGQEQTQEQPQEQSEEEQARRQAALLEIEEARNRLVNQLHGVDRALAAAVGRIQQAEGLLAENLDQRGIPGGVQLREVDERDIVDEWLTIILIALGTSIALMTWRIALRYYSLFFF